MSSSLQFDETTARQVDAIYLTDDVRRRRKVAIETLDLKPGETVLDIGTGVGFLAFEVADIVGTTGSVLGIDLAEPMLDLARRRCASKPQVEFRKADAISLPLADSSVDAAASLQVFEYVRDADAALAELFRVLRSGGRAVVISTDWRSLLWHSQDASRMQRVLAAFEEHCAHVSLPRTLARRLRQVGFLVDEPQVLVQFNPTLSTKFYSFHFIKLVQKFVAGRRGITTEEAAAWADELHDLGERDEYFFCLNQFIFPARKP